MDKHIFRPNNLNSRRQSHKTNILAHTLNTPERPSLMIVTADGWRPYLLFLTSSRVRWLPL